MGDLSLQKGMRAVRKLIEGYRNIPAEHCGSGAMRNLLYHYSGLDLAESVVFGLGAGLDAIYFPAEWENPPYMLFGRSVTMEQDLAAHLGLDYREQAEPDNQAAWEAVKREVLAGRPVMLSGDIFYLDYREFKIHFPSHRFVLLGFDEAQQEVYLADRTRSEIETCSMAALAMSRNPPVGISTQNLWGKFSATTLRHSLPQAVELAIETACARMLGNDHSQRDLIASMLPKTPAFLQSGVAGIRLLAEQFGEWQYRENALAHLRYLDAVIVKFGTGGALFRNLYGGFLYWAQSLRPDLVDDHALALIGRSQSLWNQLVEQLAGLQQAADNPSLWLAGSRPLSDIYDAEAQLFEGLAASR